MREAVLAFLAVLIISAVIESDFVDVLMIAIVCLAVGLLVGGLVLLADHLFGKK